MESDTLRHLSDLAHRAAKTGLSRSKFLTPAEIAEADAFFHSSSGGLPNGVTLQFDGGFGVDSAERRVAVFTADWEEYDREQYLAAITIAHRDEDSIGHRDILGATLGLGLDRSVLGDINAAENPAVMIVLAEQADYICENLQKIGRVGVNLKRVQLTDLPEPTENYNEHSDTVASLRIDGIISCFFNISRKLSAEYIAAGRVSLSHLPCENPAKTVSAGDIISIRGVGRGKLLEINGEPKKGRTWIRYGIY
jgi:RNA-binding protein YlmH